MVNPIRDWYQLMRRAEKLRNTAGGPAEKAWQQLPPETGGFQYPRQHVIRQLISDIKTIYEHETGTGDYDWAYPDWEQEISSLEHCQQITNLTTPHPEPKNNP